MRNTRHVLFVFKLVLVFIFSFNEKAIKVKKRASLLGKRNLQYVPCKSVYQQTCDADDQFFKVNLGFF